MLKDFKQFVPSSVCLTCDGCCRFKEADSRWRPYMTGKEQKVARSLSVVEKIFGPHAGHSQELGPHAGHSQELGPHAGHSQELGPRAGHSQELGPLVVSSDGRIATTPCGGGFLCHFFNNQHNTCGIYHARPFECQLYPFLLGKKGGKAVLYVHLNCPYIQEHGGGQAYKDYAQYLQDFFKKKETREFLQQNPALLTDYSAFAVELDEVCVLSLE